MSEIHLYEHPKPVLCPVCGNPADIHQEFDSSVERRYRGDIPGIFSPFITHILKTSITCYHCGTTFRGTTLGGTHAPIDNSFIIHPEVKS